MELIVMSEALQRPVAFYHRDGLVAAWNHAARYAGPDGHVATLPEIVELRLHAKAGPNESPWENWYTSSSAEYVGVGADGRVKIIVAHGVGPMATIAGIMAAYKWEYSDRKERRRTGGRITAQQFLDLEAGKYGDVNVVDLSSPFMHDPDSFPVAPVNVLDFQDYLVPYGEERFYRYLTLTTALLDPLLRLRLGANGHRYIRKHAHIARKFHRDERLNVSRLRPGHLNGGDTPYITKVETPLNCPYMLPVDTTVPPPQWVYGPRVPEEGYALAHLLDVDAFTELHTTEVGTLLHSAPGVHEWWNGAKFVAVPGGATLQQGVAAGPDAHKVLGEHWQHFMEPVEPGYVPVTPYQLKPVGAEWFACYPKQYPEEECLDTGELEFRATTVEPIRGIATFQTDDDFFLRYSLKQVRAIMPTGANAYEVLDVSRRDAGGLTTVTVRFYRAEVDISRRLPRVETLARDYDRLMEVYTS